MRECIADATARIAIIDEHIRETGAFNQPEPTWLALISRERWVHELPLTEAIYDLGEFVDVQGLGIDMRSSGERSLNGRLNLQYSHAGIEM